MRSFKQTHNKTEYQQDEYIVTQYEYIFKIKGKRLHFQPILNKKQRQLGGLETQQNQFIAQSNKVG